MIAPLCGTIAYVPSSRGRKLFAYVELLQWLLTSITTPFTYSKRLHHNRVYKTLPITWKISSSTGIELMNMPSQTAVCDNSSIVITVVCIHWLYIKYNLLSPFIKMSKCQTNSKSFFGCRFINTLNERSEFTYDIGLVNSLIASSIICAVIDNMS